jgi:hypothetical protein
MGNLVFAGLFTEGTTDIRFLDSIVKKTLDSIAFECSGQIETELIGIKIDKTGLGFTDQVLRASEKAFDSYGISILFVHTDADDNSDKIIFETKINPAQGKIELLPNRTMVPIVPVYMTESWMLADKDLLRDELGTSCSIGELHLTKYPEEMTDPKEAIENAIRISKENQTKRKRNQGLVIEDLYQIIGQKVELERLDKLPSYLKFKNNLKQAFRDLNLLH